MTRRPSLRHFVIALTCLVGVVSINAADKIDPRLATVRKAFIQPRDDLGQEDRQVAVCLPEKLKAHTPIVAVESKDAADVVFVVSAKHLGRADRNTGVPVADLDIQLPDGTSLWTGEAKHHGGAFMGAYGMLQSPAGIGCGLADRLANTLMHAMQKARK